MDTSRSVLQPISVKKRKNMVYGTMVFLVFLMIGLFVLSLNDGPHSDVFYFVEAVSGITIFLNWSQNLEGVLHWAAVVTIYWIAIVVFAAAFFCHHYLPTFSV